MAETIDLRAVSSSIPAGSGNEAYSSAVDVGAIDGDGTLTAAAGVAEPTAVPTTAINNGSAADVLDFTISDGGTADGLKLDVSDIVLHTAGTAPFDQVTWKLSGPGSGNPTGSYSSADNTVTFTGLNLQVNNGSSNTYTVSAYFSDNTGLTEGTLFQLSLDGDTDLTVSGTQMSGGNAAITNSTGSPVQVTATQLTMATQPAPLAAVSGTALDFSTDPVIEARDAAGNVDLDFSDTITLTETGAGSASYAGNSVAAVAGVADFGGLAVTYTATTEGESFALQADDTAGGLEGDLPPVTTSALTADAVATHLVFSTQPQAATIAGVDFAAGITVEARDGGDLLDTDYAEAITLAAVLASDNNTAGSGTLASADVGGLSQSAVAGAASWTDLTYDTAENIDVRATATSFGAGSGDEAYSSVVAVSGPDTDGALTAAGGVSEPVALLTTVTTAGGAVDLFDFALSDGASADGLSLNASEIALHTAGAGPFAQVDWRLDGPDAANVPGVYSGAANTLTFSGLSISVADGASETYTLSGYYSDNTGLIEGAVFQLSVDGDDDVTIASGTVMSGANTAVTNGAGSPVDVTATQLAVVAQPAPLTVTSGVGFDFTSDPAIAAHDAAGNVDVDFIDTVTLTKTGAGSATYTNNAVAAVAGLATFSGLTITYGATVDGESFTLQADDTAAGTEGDLPSVMSSSLSADVVATHLLFTTQPPASATAGLDFAGSVVVEARDGDNLLDANFGDAVTLAAVLASDNNTAGSGALASTSGLSQAATSGLVSWTDLTYDTAETIDVRATSIGFTAGSGNEAYSSAVIVSGIDSDGALTGAAGVSEPVALATDVTSAVASVDVFDFALSDGGAADGLALNATDVVLHTAGGASFDQVVWRLDGPDVGNATGTYSAGANTITFSGLSISVADGAAETYTVNAYYSDNTGLTDGAVFQLSLDGDDDLTLTGGTQMSGANGSVANGAGSAVDVTATQLVVVTQPAPLAAVSGVVLDFTTDPVIEARDGAGNVDADFSDTVAVTESGAGWAGYSNNTVAAVAGIAAFGGLRVTYVAAVDGEPFSLQADDTAGGAEGDLPTALSVALSADVVATHLVFSTQPPAGATAGLDFAGSIAVAAQDANSRLDTDFVEGVTLAAVLASDNNTAGSDGLCAGRWRQWRRRISGGIPDCFAHGRRGAVRAG